MCLMIENLKPIFKYTFGIILIILFILPYFIYFTLSIEFINKYTIQSIYKIGMS